MWSTLSSIRAVGPEMPTLATTVLSGPKTGAATPESPISSSSRVTAKPRERASSRSSSRSLGGAQRLVGDAAPAVRPGGRAPSRPAAPCPVPSSAAGRRRRSSRALRAGRSSRPGRRGRRARRWPRRGARSRRCPRRSPRASVGRGEPSRRCGRAARRTARTGDRRCTRRCSTRSTSRVRSSAASSREVVERASPEASLSSAKVTATSASITWVSSAAARSTAWVPPGSVSGGATRALDGRGAAHAWSVLRCSAHGG